MQDNGKVAIITGAASGIGKALAQQMARKGVTVCLCDLNRDLVERTAESLVQEGHVARATPLDVSDFQQVRGLVETTVSDYGRIDYIFNNAGIGVGGEVRDLAYDDWKRVIDVNLFGVINGVLAAYPIMLKQGFGHIINTSSLGGLSPVPGQPSYITSKYAVVGLTHTLRIEAADLGVKVTLVCPGKVDTPIYETSKIVHYDRKRALAMLPRGISPEACASIILRGVERNRATILITPMAKLAWWLTRLSPNLVLWLSIQYMRRLRRARLVA